MNPLIAMRRSAGAPRFAFSTTSGNESPARIAHSASSPAVGHPKKADYSVALLAGRPRT
jgi:hypothetical protein